MRLSDLIERPVVDQHGRSWGAVHDAHLVQDGPLLPSGRAAYRVHGLMVGRASFGTRLGYVNRPGKGGVAKGPLPIKLVVRWLHRKAVYIPWSAVQEVEPERVLVLAPEGGFEVTSSK